MPSKNDSNEIACRVLQQRSARLIPTLAAVFEDFFSPDLVPFENEGGGLEVLTSDKTTIFSGAA